MFVWRIADLQCLDIEQIPKSWTNGSQVDLWKKPAQQEELRSRNVKKTMGLTRIVLQWCNTASFTFNVVPRKRSAWVVLPSKVLPGKLLYDFKCRNCKDNLKCDFWALSRYQSNRGYTCGRRSFWRDLEDFIHLKSVHLRIELDFFESDV